MQTFPITLDGSNLFHRALILADAGAGTLTDWFDSRVPQTFNLKAGDYRFYVDSGHFTDVLFSITTTGTIQFPASFNTFLSLRGTNTLVLNGFQVTLDARYLLGAGVLLAGVSQGEFANEDWIRHKTIRLLPAPNYLVAPGSGVQGGFSFKLDFNGKFDFNATQLPFLKGKGTNTLIFRGYPVLIDATAITNWDSLILLEVWYNASDVLGDSVPFAYNKVLMGNLLPLRVGDAYMFQTHEGLYTPYHFTIDLKGVFSVNNLAKLRLDKFNRLTRVTLIP
jgi:hypothetical protein